MQNTSRRRIYLVKYLAFHPIIIDDKLQQQMETHCTRLNKNLDYLQAKQWKETRISHNNL